jgi:hypothetical protein
MVLQRFCNDERLDGGPNGGRWGDGWARRGAQREPCHRPRYFWMPCHLSRVAGGNFITHPTQSMLGWPYAGLFVSWQEGRSRHDASQGHIMTRHKVTSWRVTRSRHRHKVTIETHVASLTKEGCVHKRTLMSTPSWFCTAAVLRQYRSPMMCCVGVLPLSTQVRLTNLQRWLKGLDASKLPTCMPDTRRKPSPNLHKLMQFPKWFNANWHKFFWTLVRQSCFLE